MGIKIEIHIDVLEQTITKLQNLRESGVSATKTIEGLSIPSSMESMNLLLLQNRMQNSTGKTAEKIAEINDVIDLSFTAIDELIEKTIETLTTIKDNLVATEDELVYEIKTIGGKMEIK